MQLLWTTSHSWAVYLNVSMNTCVDGITSGRLLSSVLSMKRPSKKVTTKMVDSARYSGGEQTMTRLRPFADVAKGSESGAPSMRP